MTEVREVAISSVVVGVGWSSSRTTRSLFSASSQQMRGLTSFHSQLDSQVPSLIRTSTWVPVGPVWRASHFGDAIPLQPRCTYLARAVPLGAYFGRSLLSTSSGSASQIQPCHIFWAQQRSNLLSIGDKFEAPAIGSFHDESSTKTELIIITRNPEHRKIQKFGLSADLRGEPERDTVLYATHSVHVL